MTKVNRQPKGQSTGGQFTSSMNSESTLELTDEGTPISRAGELCSILSGPDVVGSPEERMLWHHAYDISNVAFNAGLSDNEATERISAALDETIQEAQAMKARLAGSAVGTEPSPYADFAGYKVSNLKGLIANLPDDEPLLYWLMSRNDVSGYVDQASAACTPEQWMEIYDKFGEKTDRDYGPWSGLGEAFSESVDEVFPQYEDEEQSSDRQMNRDDFADLYEPISKPGCEDEDGRYGSLFETFGEDLDFVQSQPKDRVWTLVDEGDGGEVIHNGFHTVNRIGFLVTKEPWNEEYDYAVTH